MKDFHVGMTMEDGNLIVKATQDCTPIAEMAKRLQIEGMTGSSEMKYAGEIPNVMIEAYCAKTGITFEEWLVNKAHIRAMLNDPALAHFRIWKGTV